MPSTSVIDEREFFAAAELRLEGVLSYRDDVERGRRGVVLAPHPHFAGDLDNNVVRALAAGLAAAGDIVLRFNYHGVGASDAPRDLSASLIDYWRQVEETRDYARAVRDATCAFRHLLAVAPGRTQGAYLVGYSFGALVAALVAPALPDLEALVLVAPPFARIDPERLQPPGCPALVLAGEGDFVYDAAALALARVRLGAGVEVETWPDADHFFRGEEERVADRILAFLPGEDGA